MVPLIVWLVTPRLPPEILLRYRFASLKPSHRPTRLRINCGGEHGRRGSTCVCILCVRVSIIQCTSGPFLSYSSVAISCRFAHTKIHIPLCVSHAGFRIERRFSCGGGFEMVGSASDVISSQFIRGDMAYVYL